MKCIELRTAVAEDFEGIVALYRHLSPDDDILYDRPQLRSVWNMLLAHNGTDVCLGQRDGRLVSTCTLIVTPNITRGGRPYALIENVVTLSDCRGRGFGKAIVNFVIKKAWEAGCCKVMLMSGRADLLSRPSTGILAGTLFRLGNLPKGEGHERRFLNDALIVLQAKLLGASVLTGNVRDFDYLNQLVPSVRGILYRQVNPS